MISLAQLRKMVEVAKDREIPPQMIGDELVYCLPLLESNVELAFLAGLQPFCPMPGTAGLLPWYPTGQVRA